MQQTHNNMTQTTPKTKFTVSEPTARRTLAAIFLVFAAIIFPFSVRPAASQVDKRVGSDGCGEFLRVTPPVRIVRSGIIKPFDARAFESFQPFDRIEIGPGGSAELSFSSTGKHYRLTHVPNSDSTRGVVEISRDGSDIAAASLAAAGHPGVIVTPLRSISLRLAGRFTTGGRVGPKSGSVTIRGWNSADHRKPSEDVLLDPTRDTVIRWEGGLGTVPSDKTGVIFIYSLDASPIGETIDPNKPIWHASLSMSTPQTVVPHGTLRTGGRYHWTIQSAVAAGMGDHEEASGRLSVLSSAQRSALAADLAELESDCPDTKPTDPMPLIEKALILRYYGLQSETADTVKAALARKDDPQWRAVAVGLAARPVSIRAVAAP